MRKLAGQADLCHTDEHLKPALLLRTRSVRPWLNTGGVPAVLSAIEH